MQMVKESKDNLKKNKAGRFTLPDNQDFKTTVIDTVWN